MTDFEYDVMQKKRIARGDRCKKRGSKSKYCGLPSDRMTQKEWKARNGKVMTYNLKRRMDWRSFKSMPQDLQYEYIRSMVLVFGAKGKDVAAMFGVTNSTFSRYMGSHLPAFRFGTQKHSQLKPEWQDFLDGVEMVTSKTPAEPVIPVEEERTPAMEREEDPAERVDEDNAAPEERAVMSELSMEFRGPLDLQMIANSLRSIFHDGDNWTVHVRFSRIS